MSLFPRNDLFYLTPLLSPLFENAEARISWESICPRSLQQAGISVCYFIMSRHFDVPTGSGSTSLQTKRSCRRSRTPL
jgi:hypothetical protein